MSRCDIIIPIYNAYDCLRECFDSVLKYTDFKRAHLILIDDKSPDSRVLPLLKEYKEKNKGKITLLRNDENLGFVATVNKGMKYSKNDVLLLNSDAVVTEGWLDKLIKCGMRDKRIATVTPVANNVTPAHLPESFRRRGFPDGYNLSKMAKLVENCSMHLYPEVPSAHGFCMYIKREAIRAVGYFDEETFGKGYGEENDFCFRCFEKEYYHVLCDDAFVLHKGSQSFLDKKKFHDDELRKKHPIIREKVDTWYKKQDLDKVIDNIVLAIGVEEDRVNILLIMREKITEQAQTIIDELRYDKNIHVLEQQDGYYTVRSFFKDFDLLTAIYEKPVVFLEDEKESGEYKRMIDDIKKCFGISVTEAFYQIDKKALLRKCKKQGMVKKLDYKTIRDKMLNYRLLISVLRGIEINKNEIEKKERELAEKEREEWRKQLTIPQKVYLKIRYIIIGK